MKNLSDNRLFKTLIFLLTIVVIAKAIWLAISILFLPKEGIEHSKVEKIKPLYYRTKLARKPKKVKKPKVIKRRPPPPVVNSMKGIKLLGIYSSSDIIIVTVQKGSKTKTLEKSKDKAEDIDGFVLTSAGRNYAIFRKNGKEFKLEMIKKIKNSKNYIRPEEPKKHYKKKENQKIINGDDETQKIISRNLLKSYRKDETKIWKDIGIGEYKENGVLKGFKVNFVKKGSDFAKLGLKKGDILIAINGEELSYKTAYTFYTTINSIDDLTLTIKRNNQEMELEYEIQ